MGGGQADVDRREMTAWLVARSVIGASVIVVLKAQMKKLCFGELLSVPFVFVPAPHISVYVSPPYTTPSSTSPRRVLRHHDPRAADDPSALSSFATTFVNHQRGLREKHEGPDAEPDEGVSRGAAHSSAGPLATRVAMLGGTHADPRVTRRSHDAEPRDPRGRDVGQNGGDHERFDAHHNT